MKLTLWRLTKRSRLSTKMFSVLKSLKLKAKLKKRASDLLKSVGLENGLRTLGSLQLASALAFSEFSTLSLFVASDAAIIHAARLLGLKTMAS